MKRFLRLVENHPSGCWLWKGGIGTNGYGNFWLDGRTIGAHRFSYEQFVGPRTTGKQLDHLCRNRLCVNPAHLELVTARENNARSRSPSAANAKKTHCPKGHPYDAENTYKDRYGRRSCKICKRDAARRFKIRQRNS